MIWPCSWSVLAKKRAIDITEEEFQRNVKTQLKGLIESFYTIFYLVSPEIRDFHKLRANIKNLKDFSHTNSNEVLFIIDQVNLWKKSLLDQKKIDILEIIAPLINRLQNELLIYEKLEKKEDREKTYTIIANLFDDISYEPLEEKAYGVINPAYFNSIKDIESHVFEKDNKGPFLKHLREYDFYLNEFFMQITKDKIIETKGTFAQAKIMHTRWNNILKSIVGK